MNHEDGRARPPVVTSRMIAVVLSLLCAAPAAAAGADATMSRFGIPFGKPAVQAGEKFLGRDSVPLFLALVKNESNFNPKAVSTQGAVGLCQILASTAKKEFGVNNAKILRNPAKNLELGARYLKKLLALSHGDAERALSYYHSGPGVTGDWCGDLGTGCASPLSAGYIAKIRRDEVQYRILLCGHGYFKKGHVFCAGAGRNAD